MLKTLRARIVLFLFVLLAVVQVVDLAVLALLGGAEVRSLGGLMLQLGVLGVLLGVLAGFALTRLVMAPVGRLAQAALILERGDYDRAVDCDGPEEIGTVAASSTPIATTPATPRATGARSPPAATSGTRKIGTTSGT